MRRRNTTTEFLKECMADALFRLLKEKKMEEISISEITDLADVGRVTFYRNFNKKEDLIAYKFKRLGEDFYQDVSCTSPKSRQERVLKFFTFIYSIREYLTILYQANLMETFFFPLSELIRQRNQDNPTKIFQDSFLSFGTMGIVLAWIQDGFQESPEELLKILATVKL